MARKNRKNNNVVKVDFTDVESNVLLPEVQGATLKVVSAAAKDNDGGGSIVIRYEVIKADNKKLVGKTSNNYFNLGESSLWVLRNFLEAVGVEVPAGPLDIDLTELPDLEFVADITQNDYNGRTSNRLANFSMTDGDSKKDDEDEDEVIVKGKKRSKDEDEEDEDDAPKSKKKSKKSSDDEDDEDEAPRKKSKKVVDEDDEEDEAPKSKKKSRKSDDDEDEEEEAPKKKSKRSKDEDDEDEEEAPKSKKKKNKAVITADEVRDMDEKELKALVREHELDVDLSEFSNLRKKVLAVIDELDAQGLLDND